MFNTSQYFISIQQYDFDRLDDWYVYILLIFDILEVERHKLKELNGFFR